MTARPISLLGGQPRTSGSAGFTLAEILVATVIAGLLGTCLVQFIVSTSRLVFDSTAQVDMSADVRSFTSDLSRVGRSARAFYIYPTYSGSQVAANRRSAGGSGDFIVFIWVEPGKKDGLVDYTVNHYSRVVGYGRTTEQDGYGPVLRFDRNLPRTDEYRTSAMTVEELVQAVFPSADNPGREVVELARGLAEQKLFSNYRGNSVIVNGEILHGSLARRITNIYNFTVTPRG